MQTAQWFKAAVLMAPLAVSSCMPSRQARMAEADARLDAISRGPSEGIIGHTYWVGLNQQVKLYQTDDDLGPYTVLTTGKVTFDAIARPPAGGKIWLRLTTSAGQSGFIFVSSLIPLIYFSPTDPMAGAVYPTYFSDLKANDKRRSLSGIVLGMTEAQVLASAWGKPERTKEIKKAQSDKDAWYYSGGNTLFFDYGRLYEIEK